MATQTVFVNKGRWSGHLMAMEAADATAAIAGNWAFAQVISPIVPDANLRTILGLTIDQPTLTAWEAKASAKGYDPSLDDGSNPIKPPVIP
jgi:hypothetical protein